MKKLPPVSKACRENRPEDFLHPTVKCGHPRHLEANLDFREGIDEKRKKRGKKPLLTGNPVSKIGRRKPGPNHPWKGLNFGRGS